MKFIIEKASDWDYEIELEINTLEELKEFVDNHKEKIVISEDFKKIIIYDDYLE